MGNHSSSHAAHKTRKNVHWKSAGRPTAPGKPDIIPLQSDDEPNAITLKWAPPAHDGGAPLRGYQVECNRLGSIDWVRTAPPVVLRPELLLTGLEPPHRYQFRVAAINAVGRSEYSELSDVLTVNTDSPVQHPPVFHQHIENITALENDKTEFRVTFSGSPPPTIAWFKDDYEIFSSRRTTISTNESSSVLVFYQTLSSDEGEIKCTATNRAGHTVCKAKLSLEAAPKLRYPRQYEDGLLYEINETVFLKTTIVGKPTPVVEWRHDGQPLIVDDRVTITNTPKFSMLKIISARRSDRGEYQVHAKNNIGEDTAAFLVTVTAPPDAPRNVLVARQVDKSVTLGWEPPADDGGCRIGNYVVEYYRSGWNVWLKATTSRKTNVTLFDLIEGSEYRFRVKAESPYGMSAPSKESVPVKIPGRSVDMEFLAVESRIINEALTREGGEEVPVSPAPRRKRAAASSVQVPAAATASPAPLRKQKRVSVPNEATSNEFMLVLCPDSTKSNENSEKRKSFQLDLEDSLSPPPISLSAPELSSRCVMPFKPLRNAVSSTELLHERAMARFYKAVALKEQQSKQLDEKSLSLEQNHIPYSNSIEKTDTDAGATATDTTNNKLTTLEVLTKSESLDSKDIKFNPAPRQDSINSDKWQHMSFDEDYTASTVSTDGDYTDEEDNSLNEELEREDQLMEEEETYNPRNKVTRPSSSVSEPIEEEEEPETEPLKPLLLPDPNFIPKPILKKRETDAIDNKTIASKTIKEDKSLQNKQKKDDKINLFSKITKQKPFSFPKMLSKKQTDKPSQPNAQVKEEKLKVEAVDDKLSDEGKTVIDYYGNIVKEYGSHKKASTPLYLNTEDLKQVAEKQTREDIKKNDIVPKKKKVVKKVQKNKVNSIKIQNPKSPEKTYQTKQDLLEKQRTISDNTEKFNSSTLTTEKPQSNETRVLLKTTERATVVIPIDYKKMEERAKVNVRSAIDYTVDVCLLLVAFWVYFFKDERLAIPLLILIIYRQVQESILQNIPEWINRYLPQWMKKKTS
nr:titin homolog [Vanessa tameamea]